MKRPVLLLALTLLGCQSILTARQMHPLQVKEVPAWVANAFTVAQTQSEAMYNEVMKTGLLPRSIQRGLQPKTDWTAGFFPGTLWYLYTYTGEDTWKTRAEKATALMEGEQNNAFDHDIGFKMYSCFGNGYLLTGNKAYRHIIFRSAKTLTSRYSYKTGLIMSWEPDVKRDWLFPVIIDNMINLELLMEAYKMSGDTTLRHIAVSHADKTMKYHYRKNMSCPHVVDYEPETGAMRKYDWNNGSDDTANSTWSRGQSWGLYGFTMMYRETGKPDYLNHAKHIASFIMNHPNMPVDKIPYWDFDAPGIPNVPRDASAAAIMASALIELSQLDKSTEAKSYLDFAEQQIRSLTSPDYLAAKGTNCNFALMHSTGHFPGKSEVDVPLSYADYYYVEALMRLRNQLKNKSL